MNTILLRDKMTRAARSTAPVKTGNLKWNGIYSVKTVNGFKIVWDRQYAHYINIQDQKYHKDFVRLGMLKATMQLREKTLKRTLRSDKVVSSDKYLPYFMTNENILVNKGKAKMLKNLKNSVNYMLKNEPYYANKTNVIPEFDSETGKLTDIYDYENELIN